MGTLETGKYYIVSGENGGRGTIELYTGKLTPRSVRARLTRERSGGDRWALFGQAYHTATGPTLVWLDSAEIDRLAGDSAQRPAPVGGEPATEEVGGYEEEWEER